MATCKFRRGPADSHEADVADDVDIVRVVYGSDDTPPEHFIYVRQYRLLRFSFSKRYTEIYRSTCDDAQRTASPAKTPDCGDSAVLQCYRPSIRTVRIADGPHHITVVAQRSLRREALDENVTARLGELP